MLWIKIILKAALDYDDRAAAKSYLNKDIDE